VRVTCGDFERVLGPSVTEIGSTNAVFLDPPYLTNEEIYGMAKGSPALRALEWCKANWNNPNLKIALCGYEGEFEIPSDWRVIAWKGAKGYADAEKNKNRERERIWLSPACMPLEERKQLSLW
jgi:16S rRNA G966 N2-methylase RsmD